MTERGQSAQPCASHSPEQPQAPSLSSHPKLFCAKSMFILAEELITVIMRIIINQENRGQKRVEQI
jgi:hypothetical protein